MQRFPRFETAWTLLTASALLLGTVLLPGPAARPAEAAWDGETQAFLGLINNYRQQNGKAALALDATLQNAANFMSDDMLAHCVLPQTSCSHTDSTGRDPFQRMRDYGYAAGTQFGAGENIAWGWGGGMTSAQQAFDGWKNSPGHNQNMLNDAYRAIGIARSCSGGSCAWVTDFGTQVVQPSGGGGATTTTFVDVPTTDWAYNAIMAIAQRGITTGCAPSRFCPDSYTSRAEMAVFILRAKGIQPGAATGVFADVPTTYWAAGAIEQLYRLGITTGCASGRFCAEAAVTRAELAVFLQRAKGIGVVTPSGVFADVPTTYWAAGSIEALYRAGITTGCGGGRYCPANYVTRREMAALLVRAFP